ncbi:hypothetical protein K2173_018321 [Erythroxylum novogranatense]|uniref:RNase H type-1 domain-containing protein n=1 Tax=Erythroxylum novogranatense TaxID=1862640 RepID=A0AAV8UDP1_9ROSI|nr:hypothetical protein K2173_018321 [Erythroxylum novogranatense]
MDISEKRTQIFEVLKEDGGLPSMELVKVTIPIGEDDKKKEPKNIQDFNQKDTDEASWNECRYNYSPYEFPVSHINELWYAWIITILIAELMTLRFGLAFASDYQCDGLVMESDSVDAPDVLTFHPFVCLISDIQSHHATLLTFIVVHVFREDNQCVAFLARLSSGTIPDECVWPTLPPGLLYLLRADA